MPLVKYLGAGARPRNWHFDIDIVGGCNLSCPSCPVGNSDYGAVPKGYMKPELLRQILEKAKRECGRPTISLYNWTEPFLHPRLADMIAEVKRQGLHCTLSSNLNILRNAAGVIAARPDVIRISVSGFDQSRYGATHRGGDIEKVKANMQSLAAENRKAGSPVTLTVLFHRYIDNAADEIRMREFAEALGYRFKPIWAFFMPVEKVFEICEPGSTDQTITDEDREIIAKLALPTLESLKISARLKSTECGLRENQYALTVRGDVMLCCSTFDQSKFKIANYLDQPGESLQAMKSSHEGCAKCMQHGLNSLSVYEPRKELDALAYRTVKAHDPAGVHRDAGKGAFRVFFDPVVKGVRDNVRRIRGKISNRAAS